MAAFAESAKRRIDPAIIAAVHTLLNARPRRILEFKSQGVCVCCSQLTI